MRNIDRKRNIIFVIITLVIFGSNLIPIVSPTVTKDTILLPKISNCISSAPPGPLGFYFFVTNLTIRFNGTVDHYGLMFRRWFIWLSWTTDDPVYVSGIERFSGNFSFYEENGMSAKVIFFTGLDGVQIGKDSPPGNVSGRAILLRVIS